MIEVREGEYRNGEADSKYTEANNKTEKAFATD